MLTTSIEYTGCRRRIAPRIGLGILAAALLALSATAQAQSGNSTPAPQDDLFPDLIHPPPKKPAAQPANNTAPKAGESTVDLTQLKDDSSPANRTVAGNWTQSDSTTTNDLRGVAWGNGTFVAVGVDGTVLTSSDGGKWATQSSHTTDNLFGVACNGELYVCIGTNGTIVTSPDAIHWTAQTSGVTDGLVDVKWAQNQFIAAGENGTILTSPDGVTWTARDSHAKQRLYGIAWNGTLLVIVGDPGAIVTSADGITFTRRAFVMPVWFHRLVWAKTQFVGATNDLISSVTQAMGGRADILTSPDGVTWTPHPSHNAVRMVGIAWNGRLLVAAGDTIDQSADGQSWAKTIGSVSSTGTSDVACNDHEFVAVGDHGDIFRLIAPGDGNKPPSSSATWATPTPAPAAPDSVTPTAAPASASPTTTTLATAPNSGFL
jgi:hypothetical protein